MKGDQSITKLPPYLLVTALGRFRSFLLFLYKRLFPGNVVLYEQFQNIWLLPALYVAAELDIAGHLHRKPRSVEELAVLTGSDRAALYRLLRALASQGIFTEKKQKHFSNSATSLALVDGRDSIRSLIRHHLGPVNWNTMGSLMHTVKTGDNAFEFQNGMPIYEFLKSNQVESGLFDMAMSELSQMSFAPVIRRYRFPETGIIADIGGGEGKFLTSVLKSYSGTSGILFDMAEATLKANQLFAEAGVSDRVTVITGNFMESIPVTADLYILKNVIHNWSDEECIRLLSILHDSMPLHAKILIIEMIILPGNRNPLSKLIDIQMMAAFSGGKERTRDEFDHILLASGLRMTRFIPTIAPLFLIEAAKK